MKKLCSLTLTMILLVSLAACGTSAESETTAARKSSTAAPVVTEDAGTAPSATEKATEPEAPAETLPEMNTDATIEETVLVDENDIKITATDLTYNNYSVEVELLIENNSQTDLQFICESMGYSRNSVNGYMMEDGYLNCDVAAGKKAVDSIQFSTDALKLYGLDTISDIELGFDISDDDHNDFYTGPRQIRTSAYDSYDYSTDHFQQAITSPAAMNTFHYTVDHHEDAFAYNANGITGICSALITNEDGEKLLLAEVENTSDQAVNLQTSNIAVNDLTVYASSWCSDVLTPGKRGIITIEMDSVLKPQYREIYGITDIGKIAFTLTQTDDERNELADPADITLTVQDEFPLNTDGKEVFNENGIRILSMGIEEDASEYSDNLHALFLVGNSSDSVVQIDDVYNSVSANGFMMDYILSRAEVKPGQYAILDIDLWDSSLEDAKITASDDISELEAGLEIKYGNQSKEEYTVHVDY